ncbi:MAG: maleylpyruvate isomerase family protein, partial [Actinobacteria bacterium]
MSTRPDQWHRAWSSVPDVLDRLLALVKDAPPDRAVTADWTVADTVAHLSTIAIKDIGLVTGTVPDLPVPGLHELVLGTTVDTVAEMNRQVLRGFTERELPVLTDRLRADVAELTRLAEGADPLREVTWLGGARLPLAGLYVHLLNELNIHAWDIARGLGAEWET